MNEFVPALVVILIGGAVAWVQAMRFPGSEARLLLLSFAAHMLSAFLQVWITGRIYGGGDIFGYTAWSNLLASALRADFVQFAPEVIKLFLHIPALIPVIIPGQGTSTGTMAAIAGVLAFVTGGSAFTLCYACAALAYFGQVALYRAFREVFGQEHRRRLLVAVLLIPSSVFWSSAVLKEPMSIMGFGFLMLGLERTIFRRIELTSFVMMAFGIMLVGLLKAYILAAAIAGLAAGIYYRSGRRPTKLGKPVQLMFALGIGAACYLTLTKILPQYSIENLGEQAALYQQVGQENPGGSTYAMGDPTDRSFAGQLVYAPFALFTAVFRPLIFESKNPLIIANALETSVLIFFFVRALARRGIRETWRFITGNAMLMFCLVFVIAFGTGVGIVTTNLGSLSRYRMPLVPFLWVLVLMLDAKKPSTVAVPAVRRAVARPRLAAPRRT